MPSAMAKNLAKRGWRVAAIQTCPYEHLLDVAWEAPDKLNAAALQRFSDVVQELPFALVDEALATGAAPVDVLHAFAYALDPQPGDALRQGYREGP
jgi:hypothetical protein